MLNIVILLTRACIATSLTGHARLQRYKEKVEVRSLFA